jgi:hypothetical protein
VEFSFSFSRVSTLAVYCLTLQAGGGGFPPGGGFSAPTV